jgi:hypothetical protein
LEIPEKYNHGSEKIEALTKQKTAETENNSDSDNGIIPESSSSESSLEDNKEISDYSVSQYFLKEIIPPPTQSCSSIHSLRQPQHFTNPTIYR